MQKDKLSRNYQLRNEIIPISIWTIAIIIDKEWLAKILTNMIPNSLTKELGDSYIFPIAESSLYVFQELLNSLYSEMVLITRDEVEAVAGNEESGKEMMMLLFEKRGADVVITEEVMEAAVGNKESGEEVMMLLLEKRGAEVVITKEVVRAAARNERSGKELMKLLLEKRGADIVITKEVVRAAAGNERSGEVVMKLLLEKRGTEVVITEEAVKAAAGNEWSRKEVIMLLLEERGAEVVITEDVIKAAATSGQESVLHIIDTHSKMLSSQEKWFAIAQFYNAAKFGNKRKIQSLLERGVEPDLPSPWKVTPLWIAVMNGYIEVVRLLLETKSVNINARNVSGQLPIL
ncbi:hypothetical protein BOTCAL_0717g00010 [Botryotinia calthae]|uniref:Uncharacterized protein n=1 Tax=Botryotinia calthae TaxID=38488 RepID=A0A4Y8CJI4_9HELO|nr:hypothetical protein BOTCAL_0717g00010 [Botryotinia calthae]